VAASQRWRLVSSERSSDRAAARPRRGLVDALALRPVDRTLLGGGGAGRARAAGGRRDPCGRRRQSAPDRRVRDPTTSA